MDGRCHGRKSEVRLLAALGITAPGAGIEFQEANGANFANR
jgi:hypothetical protein